MQQNVGIVSNSRHDVVRLPGPPGHGGDHEAGLLHPRGRARPGERRQGPACRVSTVQESRVVIQISERDTSVQS